MPDYIERLGAEIQESASGCAICLEGRSGAFFPELRSSELRSAFNEAMHVAVVRYTASAASAGVEFTSSQILEVSFRVVAYCLRHRDAARRSRPPRRLTFDSADLHGAAARTLCWFYCDLMFGADCVRYAAALMEMSVDEFTQYDRNVARPSTRGARLVLTKPCKDLPASSPASSQQGS
jgi:hypothetical protein